MSWKGDAMRNGMDVENGVLRLLGRTYKPGATTVVTVYLKNALGHVMQCEGTTVPVDGQAGYAKGCLFVDTDVAAGTTGLYVNVGTTALCNFDAVSDL